MVAMSINMICLYYNETPIIYLFFSLPLLFYFFKNYSLYNIKKNALLKNNFRQTNESLKETELGLEVQGHKNWQWPSKSHTVRDISRC